MTQICRRLHLNKIHTTGITRNPRCQVSPHLPHPGSLDRPLMAGVESTRLLTHTTQSELTATLPFRLDSCLNRTLPAGRQVVGKVPRRIRTLGILSPRRSLTKARIGKSSGKILIAYPHYEDNPSYCFEFCELQLGPGNIV